MPQNSVRLRGNDHILVKIIYHKIGYAIFTSFVFLGRIYGGMGERNRGPPTMKLFLFKVA